MASAERYRPKKHPGDEQHRLASPPSYGHDLPLPSEMNSHQEVVHDLQALWMVIRLSPKETWMAVQNQVVYRFFKDLPKDTVSWLEGHDLRWKKPRAVLIKERAIQQVQRRTITYFDGKNELVEMYKGWIEEAISQVNPGT